LLSQDDRRRLDQIERQLRAEDPGFVARMSGTPERRPRLPILVCCLVWLVVPVLAATGRWPGAFVVAVIAAVTTVTLLRLSRRPRSGGRAATPADGW